MAKVAFLGLGTMGSPMAGHLAEAGHDVTVYNRTGARAEQWLKDYKSKAKGQIKLAKTPSEAAKGQQFVFACVGNDDAVRDMTIGQDGAFQTMEKGAIFIDHSTVSALVEVELSQKAKEKGLGYIDAPVSGGQKGAQNGKLTIMCGGDKETYNKVEKIVAAYGVSCKYLGERGSGQKCKMVNQICIAGLVQALSEGLAFGKKTGLDMETVLEVIGQGSASSWQMVNSGPSMIKDKFDFGFAIDLIRKDLGLCLDEAKRTKASLPVTALVDQFYADLQNKGNGSDDVTSLIKRLE